MPDGADMLALLDQRVRGYGEREAIVAFSGGVDSSVVLAVAARALGSDRVLAVTAASPAVPETEIESAGDFAASLSVTHRVVATQEVSLEAYARNDAERCFHCKVELFGVLRRLAAEAGQRGAVLLAGTNADDLTDIRPGVRANQLFGVRNPLADEGMTKAAVRSVAHELGLGTADKPAAACLSSRIAHGIRIDPALLARIGTAEQMLRQLGFTDCRVRHFGQIAKIEVAGDEMWRIFAGGNRELIAMTLRELGWSHVTLDLAGIQSGSMNSTRAGVDLTDGHGF
ncbi:MAG: ATP-dependent sacrificial sulfur transferase LarE [Chloroflexota bacterium]